MLDPIFDFLCGSANGCDGAGIWLGALLTVLVLTYLIRDTFLFRLASSLLVGTAIGYGAAVILRNVLWQGLVVPVVNDFEDSWPVTVVPLVLGLLLLSKLVPNWSALGNVSLGYLFGVGAALAVGGALSGALAPQLGATILSLAPTGGVVGLINNLLIVVGVIGALLAFRFTTGLGSRPLRMYSAIALAWGRIGRVFIMVAFGAIFANTLTARISVLITQLTLIGQAAGTLFK